jgi:hypothetical protein
MGASVRTGASALAASVLPLSSAVAGPSANADDLIVQTQSGDVAGIATAMGDDSRGPSTTRRPSPPWIEP